MKLLQISKEEMIILTFVRLGEVAVEKSIGSRLYITCIVKGVDVRPMKNGGESMIFTMKDKDVEYEARVFSVTQETKDLVKNGKVYNVTVDVKPYEKGKGGISCIVANDGIVESETPAESFADWISNFNIYYDKLGVLMAFIKDSVEGQIACGIIDRQWDKFSKWPAATGMHHTSFGGLLMHTTCVAEKCYSDGEYYNTIHGGSFINLRQLVSAALLHDIMKTEELSVDIAENKTEYSVKAALESHVVAVAVEVRMVAKELGFDGRPEVMELEHCLLAHHGRLEYGSPVIPNTPEACILNHADMVDAELWRYNKAFKGLAEHQSKTEWVHGDLKVYYRPTIGDDGLSNI